MRPTRSLTLIAALGLAAGLSACGGAEEDTSAEASPSAEAAATQGPVEVPEGESSEDPSESPSADVQDGEQDEDVVAEGEETAANPSTTEDTAGQPGSLVAPDTDANTIINSGVRLPATGEYGIDACQFLGGAVSCFFEVQSVQAGCSGETPVGHVSFDGTNVTTECYPLGEPGLSPELGAGDTFTDPSSTYTCEVVTDAGVGVKCASRQTGVVALMTTQQATRS